MPIVLPALLAEDESSGSIDEEQIAIDARPRFPDDAYSEKLADDWWKRWGDQKDLLSKARPVAGLRITRPTPLLRLPSAHARLPAPCKTA